jgi:hypothetical protein
MTEPKYTSLPEVIYVSLLRRLIGHDDWDDDRVRRYMKRNGIALEELGGRKFVYTTPGLLRERLPEVYMGICLKLEAAAVGRQVTRVDFERIIGESSDD